MASFVDRAGGIFLIRCEIRKFSDYKADMVSPLTCEASRIELPQCTACLHRGHDSVVENDATIVVNVALGDSSGGLPAIDMVWLTPTRGADLFRCHVLCLQALICTHC